MIAHLMAEPGRTMCGKPLPVDLEEGPTELCADCCKLFVAEMRSAPARHDAHLLLNDRQHTLCGAENDQPDEVDGRVHQCHSCHLLACHGACRECGAALNGLCRMAELGIYGACPRAL